MTATVLIYASTGSGPTNATAEGGVAFSRADSITSTSAPIPIPTTTGNKYSYLRYLQTWVTVASGTSILNRQIKVSTTPTTGLKLYWFDQATYTQNNGVQGAAAGNYPPNDTNASGTPPTSIGWTTLTNAYQQWDNTTVSTGSTGKNGDYVQLCLEVSDAFDSSGLSTLTDVPLPDLLVSYDEL